MKQTVIVILAALALTACSSTSLSKKEEPLQLGRQMDTVAKPEPVVAAGPKPIDLRAEAIANGIPDWYLKAPVQEGFIFGTGTAVSRDLEMSKEKALTMAQGKIAESVGGRVTKNTRIFRADTGSTVVENSKSVIKKSTTNIDFAGTEIVEVVIKLEPNGMFRTYVLTTLPLGENNLIRKQRLEEELTRSLLANDKDDFEVNEKPEPQSSLNLLDVDNEEYKRRRDETLQKPNAVIGQITVR